MPSRLTDTAAKSAQVRCTLQELGLRSFSLVTAACGADPNMVFNSANECVCATDYTLAGIASQGTQRCLPSLQVCCRASVGEDAVYHEANITRDACCPVFLRPLNQVTAIEGQYPATSAATVTYSDVIATDGGAASSATVATSLLFQHLYMQAAVRCFNWASGW